MRSLLASSLVVALLLAASVPLASADTVGETIRILGQRYKQVSALFGSRTYEMKDGGVTVQVKQIRSSGDEVAMTFIGDRLALFRSIFEQKRVDYPGQHSRVIECPEIYKPQFFEKNGEEYYLAYFASFASQNKVAGACLPDLVAYRYLYGFVYCKKQRQLFEIDHFSDPKLDAIPGFVEALSCEP